MKYQIGAINDDVETGESIIIHIKLDTEMESFLNGLTNRKWHETFKDHIVKIIEQEIEDLKR